MEDRNQETLPPPSEILKQPTEIPIQELGKRYRAQGEALAMTTLDQIRSTRTAAEQAGAEDMQTHLATLEQKTQTARDDFFDHINALIEEELESEVPLEEIQKTLEEAFQGTIIDVSKIEKMLEFADGEIEAESYFRQKADSLLKERRCHFEILETLAHLAMASPQLKKIISNILAESLREKQAHRLLNDSLYRKTLLELQENLQRPIAENGPYFSSETNLEKLMAIHELCGREAIHLVEALNVKAYEKAFGFHLSNALESESDIIRVSESVFDKNGELKETKAEIRMKFNELGPDGEPRGEFVEIIRTVKIEREKVRDEYKTVRTVEHNLISLPSSLKANGLAAEITNNCLKVYDRIGEGVDRISLKADIDLGCYVWATFGYGWDEKNMANGLGTESLEEAIKQVIVNAKQKLVLLLREIDLVDANGNTNDTSLQKILDTYDSYAEHPLAVTPQMLASLGKGGPLFRCDNMGNWHTEEKFSELEEKARASGEDFHEASHRKGSFHAGKLALVTMNHRFPTDWYGKLELKDPTQRQLLAHSLERRRPGL
jgi:hypothetical protein